MTAFDKQVNFDSPKEKFLILKNSVFFLYIYFSFSTDPSLKTPVLTNDLLLPVI